MAVRAMPQIKNEKQADNYRGVTGGFPQRSPVSSTLAKGSQKKKNMAGQDSRRAPKTSQTA